MCVTKARWLMKKLSPGVLKVIAGTVIVAVLIIAAVLIFRGSPALIQLNSSSMTDWRLGAQVEGIDSAEDGAKAQISQFAWFEDADGSCGLERSGSTRYYMEDHAGSFCVTGFESSAREYALLGIRVGDDELEAKTQLLKKGYSITGGGLNTCTASRGEVTIKLGFDSGVVTQIAAFIK